MKVASSEAFTSTKRVVVVWSHVSSFMPTCAPSVFITKQKIQHHHIFKLRCPPLLSQHSAAPTGGAAVAERNRHRRPSQIWPVVVLLAWLIYVVVDRDHKFQPDDHDDDYDGPTAITISINHYHALGLSALTSGYPGSPSFCEDLDFGV